MRVLITVGVASVLALAGCTGDDVQPPPPPVAQETPDATVIHVPDVIGIDLAKAVQQIQAVGLETDVSTLSKAARGYASQHQTHPRVQVVVIDPPAGAEVEEGTKIVILRAECPRDKRC